MSDSRIGFGTADLGNLRTAMSDDDAWAILEAAWDSGIRYFDTAPHYGLGLSERRLGEFLRTKPRSAFTVSTKVGRLLRPHPHPTERDTEGFDVPGDLTRVWDFSPDGINRSVHESLERLGLDRVDLLLLHDPERYDLERGLASAVPAMTALRDEGTVSMIGVGSMGTQALLAASRTPGIDALMIAGRFTLADQSVVPEVLNSCVVHAVDIVNASVFNSGLLATNNPESHARFDYEEAPESVVRRVVRIRDICREHGVDLPTAALHFAARGPRTRSVLIAGRRAEQVLQSMERIRSDVPEALWTQLAEEGLIPAGLGSSGTGEICAGRNGERQ